MKLVSQVNGLIFFVLSTMMKRGYKMVGDAAASTTGRTVSFYKEHNSHEDVVMAKLV